MAVALIGWLWCNFPSLHLNRRCYSRHHDIQGYLKLFANIEAMWSRISPGILDPFSHKQDPYLGMGSWQFLFVLLPKCSTFQWIRHGQTKTHSVGNHQHHLLNSISHFCADDPQQISHHLLNSISVFHLGSYSVVCWHPLVFIWAVLTTIPSYMGIYFINVI